MNMRINRKGRNIEGLGHYFDLPVSVALERVKGHSDADEFEKEEHLEKVREAYLDLENDPLVRIVDATGTPEEIFGNVWRLVSEVRND